MFTVGQKVVCVDDQFDSLTASVYRALPVKDVVYTIRAVYVGRSQLACAPGSSDGEIGVLLVELVNPPDPGNLHKQELGFKSERFAPLLTDEETRTNQQHDEATEEVLVPAGHPH